jgi:GMP synthase (glutamine-hydrolysing)
LYSFLLTTYTPVVLSGGPALLSQGDQAGLTSTVLDLPVPVLGICFGHQTIASTYGGTVEHGGNVEWGFTTLHITRDHPLFEGLDKTQTVWMSHFDTVTALGDGFEEIGYTETDHQVAAAAGDGNAEAGGAEGKAAAATAEKKRGPNAAICNDEKQRYGFQFHVEVDSTTNGEVMLKNFVCNICKCAPTWKVGEEYLERTLQEIRDEVAGRGVFLLASGGVDSTVAAKLFQLALPPGKLKLLHIDNGMMRKDESAEVVTYFDQLGLGDALTFVDATDEFLQALEGETMPEKKRTIIGNEFIAVYEREAARMGIEGYVLGQGTIYPDTIESGGAKHAKVIKTHHNRVPLIEQMISEGRVSEPLKELYKTEVRALARQLGVPHALLSRHPFPGPGLGVRLLCATGDGRGDDVSAQIAATLAPWPALSGSALPIKSVGVKADVRSYEHPVMLTADPDQAAPTWEELLEACRLVLQEVPGVNRVIFDLSGQKHPEVSVWGVAGSRSVFVVEWS